jgi:predicted secreted protein
MTFNPAQKGIDVILYVNKEPVGGQTGATLNQSMTPIEITNKIKAEWAENMDGLKMWNIQCNGIYLANSNSLSLLEEAFMSNAGIEVEIIINDIHFKGTGLITNFPLTAVFDKQFKYNISILGTGPLERK